MRLIKHREIFENWDLLQTWVLKNYSVNDVRLDAKFKMERLRIK